MKATASDVAVELEGHGAELAAPAAAGKAAVASGWGVNADRSTAGIWASWDSVPTTTLGSAMPLLTSR